MKLTRTDFYDELAERCYELPAFRKTYARIVMDELFDLLFDTLVDGHPFRIKRTAKLVPYVKKGGRPVRNPKTMQAVTMPDRFVVSMRGAAGQSNPKGSKVKRVKVTSALISNLTERLEKLPNIVDEPILAKRAFDVFDDLMARLKDQEMSIEIRGLGVFRSREMNKKTARNPKTGETVVVKEPMMRFRFKESAVLRRALDEQMALMQ